VLEKVKEWYFRKDVINFFLEFSKNREVVAMFQDGTFGKRPFTLQYEDDIKQLVENRAISFHCSAERWFNVSALRSGMSKEQLDDLRIGFDLIIDPDTKDFKIAKIVTKSIIEALKDHSLKNFILKFSGGKSFHIFIPFEALPKKINGIETSRLYIEFYRAIIEYLKYYCKTIIASAILSEFDIKDICEIYSIDLASLMGNDGFNPYSIINLDIFGLRHLYRMFYSLHEKTLLVSVPIDSNKLENFEKEDARMENVKVESLRFKENVDSEILVLEAFDWYERNKKHEETVLVREEARKVKVSKRAIKEEFFPPCIKKILAGLRDGRKRGLFLLLNFLRISGYEKEKIWEIVEEWNKKNENPLPQRYLLSQFKYFVERRDNPYVLPSCDRAEYYDDTGFCNPDEICNNKGIKNPLNYPFKKMKSVKSS